MKYLIYGILIIGAIGLLSSCAPNRNAKTCKINKVLNIIDRRDDSYSVKVKFTGCISNKDLRKILVENEIRKRFSKIEKKTIHIDEYIGKIYNEYLYEIKVE